MRTIFVAVLLLGFIAAYAAPLTPEQERQALIQHIQKRIPGISTNDLALGTSAFERGVKVFSLNTANETNSADILAIGKKQWERPFRNGKTLATCFPNGGRRIAATYPQFDSKAKQVVTFEMALNRCLKLHGESEINAADITIMGPLSAYARSLSDDTKLHVRITSQAARDKYDAGRRLFHRRMGQQNYACASCHIQYAGGIYGSAPLSPVIGQATSWPQLRPGGEIRTLQQQFQRCMERSGATPFPIGSEELNNLEYYHAFLSTGLPLRTLGIRR